MLGNTVLGDGWHDQQMIFGLKKFRKFCCVIGFTTMLYSREASISCARPRNILFSWLSGWIASPSSELIHFQHPPIHLVRRVVLLPSATSQSPYFVLLRPIAKFASRAQSVARCAHKRITARRATKCRRASSKRRANICLQYATLWYPRLEGKCTTINPQSFHSK
jgi:hypothetical protein